MPITVNFKVSNQEVLTRRFKGGDGVSIYGKSSGLLLPDPPGTVIRVSIDSIAFYASTRTNFLGDYSTFVKLPATRGSGVVVVERYAPLGVEREEVPIAWGDEEPLPLPPHEPTPSIANVLPPISTAVKVVLIAGAVYIGAMYLLPAVTKKT